MKGGAWPILVGGLNCLVNSDNEQDLYLLISNRWSIINVYSLLYMLTLESQSLLLRETLFVCESIKRKKDNIRSVMPLDILGCTRVTMKYSLSIYQMRNHLGNLKTYFVMGIEFCNYRSWTRNALYRFIINEPRISPCSLYTPPVAYTDWIMI